MRHTMHRVRDATGGGAVLDFVSQPHREITASLGHLRRSCTWRCCSSSAASIYSPAKTNRDLPELSVQLVTRAGPAARSSRRPRCRSPRRIPSKHVIDDPGTASRRFDAPAVADIAAVLELTPDVVDERSLRGACHAPRRPPERSSRPRANRRRGAAGRRAELDAAAPIGAATRDR